MLIHQPQIIHHGQEVILQARIETRDLSLKLPEFLWFKYPERYQQYLSDRSDAFLWALILIGQSIGDDIECLGEVSPRTLYSLDEYQKIYMCWYPDIFRRQITVRARRISHPKPLTTESRYALAFSGGVDSFFMLQNALQMRKTNPDFHLQYGLFVHGSADIPLRFAGKYDALRQEYKLLFDELGLELIPVSTNIMQFGAHRILLKQFLNAPLVASALGLGSLLSGLLFGSGETFTQFHLPGNGMLISHLQSTETFENIELGSGYTRLERIKAIANWELAQRHLRVCFGFTSESVVRNCSECGKCLRTRMALHTLGKLEKFSTLRPFIRLRDYVLWGRWLEVGWGYEIDALEYAWRHKKAMVLPLMLGITIGYVRYILRRYLPGWISKKIISVTTPTNVHDLFA